MLQPGVKRLVKVRPTKCVIHLCFQPHHRRPGIVPLRLVQNETAKSLTLNVAIENFDGLEIAKRLESAGVQVIFHVGRVDVATAHRKAARSTVRGRFFDHARDAVALHLHDAVVMHFGFIDLNQPNGGLMASVVSLNQSL